jgi:hypothetical protein
LAPRLCRIGVAVVLAILIASPPAFAEPQIDRSTEATAKDLVTAETQQAIDAGLA